MPLFVLISLMFASSNGAEEMNVSKLPAGQMQLAAAGSIALNSSPTGGPVDLVNAGTLWELTVEDGRVDKAMRRWAKEAGYSFRWDADRYVLIAAPTVFTGTFESAVEQVLETPGIKQSEYPLEACVYGNQPPLLRITRLGDQKEECK